MAIDRRRDEDVGDGVRRADAFKYCGMNSAQATLLLTPQDMLSESKGALGRRAVRRLVLAYRPVLFIHGLSAVGC